MKRLLTKLKGQLDTIKKRLFSREKDRLKPEDGIAWEEQRKNAIFKEFDDFEYDVHDEAIEKVGRAIQIAHNSQIQDERFHIKFIDGYGEQFIVVIGKEKDLCSDDTFKNSRVRTRLYFTRREEVYMAIGISRDMLGDAEDFYCEYEEYC